MSNDRTLAERLERLWRQCGTGIAFTLFGIGGLFLTLLVFPFINLAFRDRQRRALAAQRTVHATWKLFIRIVVALGVIEVETDGEDLLQSDTGTLVIANHPSLLDVVLIMSLMTRTQCVVKRGVWKNFFMRGVVKAANYIPNLGDPERTLFDCVAALQAGNNIVIFPEGSRTVPGQAMHLERGFANIAIRSGRTHPSRYRELYAADAAQGREMVSEPDAPAALPRAGLRSDGYARSLCVRHSFARCA